MKKISVIMLFLIPMLWLNACKDKFSEVDYNPNVLSSKDYIRGEDAIFEVVNAFFKGVRDTLVINNHYGFIDACDVSYNASENSMTFGYGTVNRMCQDNKFRRGYFYADFSGNVFEEGVMVNITTDSLFVDDLLVDLSIDIQNLGENAGFLPEYSLKVLSGLIMLPDTSKINGVSISTDFLMVWAEGHATPAIHEDDLYQVFGTASGLSSNSYAFTINIEEPLFNYPDCPWISQGINQITIPSADVSIGKIDYKVDDGCFNEMQFIFNENLFYDFIK